MNWFKNLMPSRINTEGGKKSTIPEGLWSKCGHCNRVLYRTDLERNLQVCPKCSHHMRLSARQRLNAFLDPAEKEEIGSDVLPMDPLRFKDSKRYKDRITQAQKKSGESDVLIAIKGALKGLPVVACAFEFKFMGGSMGSVVGERFTRAANQALQDGVPLICFVASGGARMQESLLSLFQMSKTSAVLAKLSRHHLPFISVLTDPTTGGVSASLAMLGDINIAEPRALIGFAGPRVIKQTVRETLPDGFQRSEFLLEHGAIDMIVDRRDMRDKIATILSMLMHQPAQQLLSENAVAPAQSAE